MIRLDNLKIAMKQRGMKVAGLARALGVSDAYAGRIFNGKDPFTEKTARKLEAALNLGHKWLDDVHTAAELDAPSEAPTTPIDADNTPMGMGGLRVIAQETEPLPYVKKTLQAPVIEWGYLGDDLYRANEEWPASKKRDLPASMELSGSVKWVVVAEDAPVAGIRKGDMVAIDPAQKHDRVRRNQVALFKSAFGEYLLRRYNPLPSDNAAHRFEALDDEGRVLDNVRHGLELIGLCVGRYTERFD